MCLYRGTELWNDSQTDSGGITSVSNIIFLRADVLFFSWSFFQDARVTAIAKNEERLEGIIHSTVHDENYVYYDNELYVKHFSSVKTHGFV